MKNQLIRAFGVFWLTAPLLLLAQTRAPVSVPVSAPERQGTPDSSGVSALDSELFYQLVVGEITAQDGEPGAGYALILDAARKTNNAQLYQRATEIALQSRSGDAALQAAQAWKNAQPTARDPNRYVLQILIALNRIADTLEPLKTGVELAPPEDRPMAIAAIPRAYARVSDKKQASTVVEQALAPYLSAPKTAASAWAAVGRMRLADGNVPGALEAAKKGLAADSHSEEPMLLSLELMDPKLPEAEALVKKYLQQNASALPEIRMGYVRALLDAQRYGEAAAQLQTVTRQKPDFAQAWLVLGTLQLQDNQLGQAQASLERYVALSELSKPARAGDEPEPNRGLTQAYLSLAQIAEKRKDFAAADVWLKKIDNAEEMMQAQIRRASMLASQGKLEEGRQLIRGLPERNAEDARLKLMAEISLLRELKQYQLAYDLLAGAIVKSPDETDLIYDQAMMAEKLERLPEMERLLRRVIALKPDAHNAYNALGYSFADRNIRLSEARDLIRKALEYVPADPFIRDSLGWVEFRMGNQAEAARIFADAFKTKPDAEIAAHYGEVLWSMGQRDRALAIWREGQLLNPDNETLLETLKRLRVKL